MSVMTDLDAYEGQAREGFNRYFKDVHAAKGTLFTGLLQLLGATDGVATMVELQAPNDDVTQMPMGYLTKDGKYMFAWRLRHGGSYTTFIWGIYKADGVKWAVDTSRGGEPPIHIELGDVETMRPVADFVGKAARDSIDESYVTKRWRG